MRRRQALALAAVGLTSGCLGVLGGGGDGEGNGGGGTTSATTTAPTTTATTTRKTSTTTTSTTTTTTTETTTETTPTPDEAVDDNLGYAGSELDAATRHLENEVRGIFSTSGIGSISTAPAEDYLQQARDALAGVEGRGTEDQQAAVVRHQQYADFVEQSIEVADQMAVGLDHVSSANTYENSNRYGAAAEELSAASDAFESAYLSFTDAQDLLEQVDTTQIRGLATDPDGLIGAFRENINLYQLFLRVVEPRARGLDLYLEGLDLAEAGDHQEAATTLREAAEHLRTGAERAAESKDSPRLGDVFTRLECTMNRTADVSETLAEASEAAANGNSQRRQELMEEASQIQQETCPA